MTDFPALPKAPKPTISGPPKIPGPPRLPPPNTTLYASVTRDPEPSIEVPKKEFTVFRKWTNLSEPLDDSTRVDDESTKPAAEEKSTEYLEGSTVGDDEHPWKIIPVDVTKHSKDLDRADEKSAITATEEKDTKPSEDATPADDKPAFSWADDVEEEEEAAAKQLQDRPNSGYEETENSNHIPEPVRTAGTRTRPLRESQVIPNQGSWRTIPNPRPLVSRPEDQPLYKPRAFPNREHRKKTWSPPYRQERGLMSNTNGQKLTQIMLDQCDIWNKLREANKVVSAARQRLERYVKVPAEVEEPVEKCMSGPVKEHTADPGNDPMILDHVGEPTTEPVGDPMVLEPTIREPTTKPVGDPSGLVNTVAKHPLSFEEWYEKALSAPMPGWFSKSDFDEQLAEVIKDADDFLPENHNWDYMDLPQIMLMRTFSERFLEVYSEGLPMLPNHFEESINDLLSQESVRSHSFSQIETRFREIMHHILYAGCLWDVKSTPKSKFEEAVANCHAKTPNEPFFRQLREYYSKYYGMKPRRDSTPGPSTSPVRTSKHTEARGSPYQRHRSPERQERRRDGKSKVPIEEKRGDPAQTSPDTSTRYQLYFRIDQAFREVAKETVPSAFFHDSIDESVHVQITCEGMEEVMEAVSVMRTVGQANGKPRLWIFDMVRIG